jgi:hypothetical protein
MSIVLVSILLGAIWIVYNTSLKIFYTQGIRMSIKGEVGRLFINMAKELYQATSMISAQERSFTFTADTDSNGVDETVEYIWSGIRGEPLNRISDTTSPVVNSVSSLRFSYYDVNNNLLSFPVNASEVRLVAIEITVTDKDEIFSMRSRVRLRGL